jgi:hypothetical protein
MLIFVHFFLCAVWVPSKKICEGFQSFVGTLFLWLLLIRSAHQFQILSRIRVVELSLPHRF